MKGHHNEVLKATDVDHTIVLKIGLDVVFREIDRNQHHRDRNDRQDHDQMQEIPIVAQIPVLCIETFQRKVKYFPNTEHHDYRVNDINTIQSTKPKKCFTGLGTVHVEEHINKQRNKNANAVFLKGAHAVKVK